MGGHPERRVGGPVVLVVYWLIAASLGIVGALVATRQPRNAIGWMLWASSVGVAMSVTAISYTAFALSPAGTGLPVVPLIAWMSQVGLTPAIIAIIVFVPLLFPDGRLLGPRWRWVAAYAVPILGLVMIDNMFTPGPFNDTPTIVNPFGLQVVELLREPIEFAKGPGVLIAAVLAIASSVVRYRRATVVARTQLRWFGAAVGLTISLFAITILASAPGVELGPIADLGWIAGITSLSLIPRRDRRRILRYRLYEIDRIVSRTIGWAIVSGLLVAAFAGLVVSLQARSRRSRRRTRSPSRHPRSSRSRCSSRCGGACSRRWTAASTAPGTTGSGIADAFAARLRRRSMPWGAAALVVTATSAVQPRAAAVWLRGVWPRAGTSASKPDFVTMSERSSGRMPR